MSLIRETSTSKRVLTEFVKVQTFYIDNFVITDNTNKSLDLTTDNITFVPDVLSYNDYYPYGMTVPNRNYQSPEYRYGYQGSEKDDEVKGDGNSYTTHFRQLDPRIGRWLSRDPKVTAFETPYSSMSNNPILFNDVKGDTISFRGSSKDTKRVINSYSDQLGKNNMKYYEIFDDKGNLSGVDIYEACNQIARNGNDELNNELVDVINSYENTRIFKVTTRPRFETDFPKNKGGAVASMDPERIKKYLGHNKFKYVIFVADNFFKYGSSTGDYRYWEYQSPFLLDNSSQTLKIPFNDAIFHETIHISLWQSGRKNTENTVIRIMNKYRVFNKVRERGLYFYYVPGWLARQMGMQSGVMEDPFIYDDYINGTYWTNQSQWGEKRKTDTPHKTGNTEWGSKPMD